MSSVCKHMFDEPQDCGLCRDEIPLILESLQFKSDGTPIIVLRTFKGGRQSRVLQLDKVPPFITIDASLIGARNDTWNSSINRQIYLEKFRKLVFELGYLFQPSKPLTTREQTEDGPPHCYKCRTRQSFKAGSLGCKQCGYYVCRCGTCMCGFPGGKNYLNQYIPPQPSLNCNPEERREYIRVATLGYE